MIPLYVDNPQERTPMSLPSPRLVPMPRRQRATCLIDCKSIRHVLMWSTARNNPLFSATPLHFMFK